jgi:hypothetical protein
MLLPSTVWLLPRLPFLLSPVTPEQERLPSACPHTIPHLDKSLLPMILAIKGSSICISVYITTSAELLWFTHILWQQELCISSILFSSSPIISVAIIYYIYKFLRASSLLDTILRTLVQSLIKFDVHNYPISSTLSCWHRMIFMNQIWGSDRVKECFLYSNHSINLFNEV